MGELLTDGVRQIMIEAKEAKGKFASSHILTLVFLSLPVSGFTAELALSVSLRVGEGEKNDGVRDEDAVLLFDEEAACELSLFLSHLCGLTVLFTFLLLICRIVHSTPREEKKYLEIGGRCSERLINNA